MKVFLFESTRAVIRAEKAVRAAQVTVTIIPVPRSISANCGMALETEDENEARVSTVLTDLGIPVTSIDRRNVTL